MNFDRHDRRTRSLPFGMTCSDHQKPFSISPGIKAEDALNQASLLLKCASAISYEMTDAQLSSSKELAWATIQLVEMAQAIVDSLIDETLSRD